MYFFRDRLSELRVSLGMHNYKMAMDSQKRDFSVGSQNLFIHPQYYADDADIGLIKLPAAVTFSSIENIKWRHITHILILSFSNGLWIFAENIRPICLADWNEHNYQGEPATIAGWSSTFKGLVYVMKNISYVDLDWMFFMQMIGLHIRILQSLTRWKSLLTLNRNVKRLIKAWQTKWCAPRAMVVLQMASALLETYFFV